MTTENEGMLAMELRQQSLEKEMSLLKDTVWRLTGRIFVLESFLSEKFDELVVDFGLKLSLTSGGHANFLAQAMSAEATVVKLGAGMSSGGNNHTHHGESEEMSTGDHDLDGEHEGDLDPDPSPPPVGANITIEEHHQQQPHPHAHTHHNHSNGGNGNKIGHHGHGGGHHNHHRGGSTTVSLGLSSPVGLVPRESRHAHRFLYKRDPTEVEERNSTHTDDHEDGDHDQYHHSQSDFNVEEFVVFPHVPEFILGQEVQNGSALMSVATSEDSNNSERHPGRPQSGMSSPDPPPHSHSHPAPSSSFPRRNPRYKCVPCSKLFTSEWHLKAHLVKHTDSSLITTSTGLAAVVVGAAAGSTNHNQSSHQGSPTGHDSTSSAGNSISDGHPGSGLGAVKPFGCVYCGKRFKKRQELTVHLRTHTGEKPFKCPVCDRGFSQSSSMKTHLRIHTGEKPFKCRLCKSCFTVMHNYKKHLQTAHQIDDFS